MNKMNCLHVKQPNEEKNYRNVRDDDIGNIARKCNAAAYEGRLDVLQATLRNYAYRNNGMMVQFLREYGNQICVNAAWRENVEIVQWMNEICPWDLDVMREYDEMMSPDDKSYSENRLRDEIQSDLDKWSIY